MKAIIPVAGAGTRLRPHTYTQPKPLIPVAGKPIISFIVDSLVDAGVNEFVFIIGYLGEKIRLYVEERYPDLEVEFVTQEERKGLGHAIWMARGVIEDASEVFIVLGDTIFDVDMSSLIDCPYSCFGIKKVADPREFGVAEFDSDGMVSKVVEKPTIPKSNMALVGLYKIKEVGALLEALDYNIQNEIKSIGEFQLTDALMRMIEQGISFQAVPVNNWYDCGKREILLETNSILLKKSNYASSNIPSFYNTIIIHPVVIGENCKIANSIIGPNVSIGNNARIEYSIVKESILGDYATIEEVVLQYSVVGNDAAIKGLRQSLNIGDNTQIDFT